MPLPAICRTVVTFAVAALLTSCGDARSSAQAPTPPPARAADVSCDLVAAPSGSDRAAGTTHAPFRSARHLVRRLRAGQVGCLREGRYVEDVSVRRSHVSLKAYGGERAVVQGRFWIARTADDV